jgi:hypothetical protein
MVSEELRRKIEKEVKRRLEEHLDALREEFEKMRIESHRKWEEFLMKMDFPLPELVPAGIIPEPEQTAPSADLSSLRELALGIDAAANQVDALKAFLTACLRHSSRAVLLVSRGEALGVWKAEGFSPSEEASFRTLTVLPSAHPALAAAMQGSPVALPGGSAVSALLSAGDARRALLVPVVVRERISALLYADQTREGTPFDCDALALFCYLIGLAVDRLGARKIQPSPALKPIQDWEAPQETRAEAAEVEEFVEVAEPIPEAPSAPRPMPVAPPPSPAPAPSATPPAAAKPAARGIDLESTGRAYRPPAGVLSGGASILRGPLTAGEEDPHDQARKIARLLVSDIRLYNEAAIEEGKRNNDIYSRLKDDIDRARQTYEERVPESVRKNTNYFFEELIRSLADGSPEAMGS